MDVRLVAKDDMEAEPASSDQLRCRRSRLITTGMVTAGLAGLIAWVLAFDLQKVDLWQAIERPVWLLAAIPCLALPYLTHITRYKLMLDRVTRVSWGFVYNMVMACTLLNHFVIAKIGDFVEPVWLERRTGLKYWEGLQVGLVRFAFSGVGLMLLLCFCLSATALRVGQPTSAPTFWMPLLIGPLATVAGYWMLKWLARRLQPVDHPDTIATKSPAVIPRPVLSLVPGIGPATKTSGTKQGNSLRHRLQRRLRQARTGATDLVRAAADLPARAYALFVLLATLEVSLDALPYALFAYATGYRLSMLPLLVSSASLNVIEYVPTPPALLGVQSWVATVSMLTSVVPVAELAVALAIHRTLRTLLIAAMGAVPLYVLSRGKGSQEED